VPGGLFRTLQVLAGPTHAAKLIILLQTDKQISGFNAVAGSAGNLQSLRRWPRT
jgi:hypothetical protein